MMARNRCSTASTRCGRVWSPAPPSTATASWARSCSKTPGTGPQHRRIPLGSETRHPVPEGGPGPHGGIRRRSAREAHARLGRAARAGPRQRRVRHQDALRDERADELEGLDRQGEDDVVMRKLTLPRRQLLPAGGGPPCAPCGGPVRRLQPGGPGERRLAAALSGHTRTLFFGSGKWRLPTQLLLRPLTGFGRNAEQLKTRTISDGAGSV